MRKSAYAIATTLLTVPFLRWAALSPRRRFLQPPSLGRSAAARLRLGSRQPRVVGVDTTSVSVAGLRIRRAEESASTPPNARPCELLGNVHRSLPGRLPAVYGDDAADCQPGLRWSPSGRGVVPHVAPDHFEPMLAMAACAEVLLSISAARVSLMLDTTAHVPCNAVVLPEFPGESRVRHVFVLRRRGSSINRARSLRRRRSTGRDWRSAQDPDAPRRVDVAGWRARWILGSRRHKPEKTGSDEPHGSQWPRFALTRGHCGRQALAFTPRPGFEGVSRSTPGTPSPTRLAPWRVPAG